MSVRGHRRAGTAAQRGFTYLAVLIAVALLGIGLAAQSEVWVAASQRARWTQADWAGAQYAQAIASYVAQSPHGVQAYPRRLEELVEDRRGPTLRRHLRQLYPNPWAGDGRWRLLRGGDGGIVGVGVLEADGRGARDYLRALPRIP